MITRRFERDDESGIRRFWEIELDGVTLATRRGRAEGGLIDGKRRVFPSVGQATDQAEILILERQRSGWLEVPSTLPSPTRNHVLETAIVDDIDDIAAWSVYADWLQARGDPFGEWLGLSLAGALPAEDPQTRWLWSTELMWLADRLDIAERAQLEHRHGFVVRAGFGRRDTGELQGTHARLLGTLLRSPTAWLLRSLTIAVIGGGRQVDVLLGMHDSYKLEHLRELLLGDFVYPDETEISWARVGDIARVLRACPSLTTLHVRGSETRWESEIDHPRLGSLTIETGGLAHEVVEAVVGGSLPNLRRLSLWFGCHGYGATATIDHLHPLLHGDPGMVELRELALVNCEFTDAIAQALVGSDRLARLEQVDLSLGTLSERGGQVILDHAAAFRHLRSLDLDRNYLPPELARALADALPGIVRIGEQVDPAIGRGDGPPGYYAAVGE